MRSRPTSTRRRGDVDHDPRVRIVYLTDVHERFGVVAWALEQVGPVDVLVVGGDLTTGGPVDEAAQAVAAWQTPAPRVLAVAGNMDSPEIDARRSSSASRSTGEAHRRRRRHLRRPEIKRTGLAAALGGALVGAWLGCNVIDGLYGVVTATRGAAVGANAIVLV